MLNKPLIVTLRLGLILCLFLFSQLSFQATSAKSGSNFELVKLQRGIELQIPKEWWLLGADLNRIIETSTEAVMDLTNIGLPEGEQTNLISANSMPRSTYAAIRVDSIIPPSISPSDLVSITSVDIRELQTELQNNLQEILPLQGHKLIEFLGCRIEKISGHPVVVAEYRRTGPKGSVFVQINKIYTPNQEIGINLSYRESEIALWKAIILKIRSSIVVKPWP